MQKIKLLVPYISFLFLTLAACKKEESTPSTEDLLTAHVWVGENSSYNATIQGVSIETDTLRTDSTALKFEKENKTLIFYLREPSNGSLTELSRQVYTLSSDNKTLSVSNVEQILGAELSKTLDSLGIVLPTNIDIEKINNQELILKGQFQQTITVPDFPFPVPLVLSYRFVYKAEKYLQ